MKGGSGEPGGRHRRSGTERTPNSESRAAGLAGEVETLQGGGVFARRRRLEPYNFTCSRGQPCVHCSAWFGRVMSADPDEAFLEHIDDIVLNSGSSPRSVRLQVAPGREPDLGRGRAVSAQSLQVEDALGCPPDGCLPNASLPAANLPGVDEGTDQIGLRAGG